MHQVEAVIDSREEAVNNVGIGLSVLGHDQQTNRSLLLNPREADDPGTAVGSHHRSDVGHDERKLRRDVSHQCLERGHITARPLDESEATLRQ
jgi:hypothetical protein